MADPAGLDKTALRVGEHPPILRERGAPAYGFAEIGGCPMSEASLSPETVLAEMKKNGVSHIVWLPDSETNWLYLLMQAEKSLTLVGVSREGHACSRASGL